MNQPGQLSEADPVLDRVSEVRRMKLQIPAVRTHVRTRPGRRRRLHPHRTLVVIAIIAILPDVAPALARPGQGTPDRLPRN